MTEHLGLQVFGRSDYPVLCSRLGPDLREAGGGRLHFSYATSDSFSLVRQDLLLLRSQDVAPRRKGSVGLRKPTKKEYTTRILDRCL